jgi:hypothetical protein
MARKTHEEFIYDFSIKGNKNVIIIGKYVNDKTPILVKCKIDGYEWHVRPSNLLQGCGCPVCSGKVVVIGINDLAALRPEFVQYFENPEDATQITEHSNKSVNLICPNCGTRKIISANMLCKRGFNCNVCDDGISFPNKFGRALLRQLPIEHYECEWSPSWLKPYAYDNYFLYNGNQYVLEMDGDLGHGNRQFNSKEKDVDGLLRDKIKDSLASKHNIEVIRIDCKKSEADYIVDSILRSDLPSIFDLTNVNWNQCEQDAVKNLVKEVCEEYSHDNSIFISDLAKKYNISRLTVRKYLKKGTKFGWCAYNSEKSIQNGISHISKEINVFDIKNNFIKTYESVNRCAIELSNIYNIKFDNTNIGRAAISGKLYHGLYFKYT